MEIHDAFGYCNCNENRNEKIMFVGYLWWKVSTEGVKWREFGSQFSADGGKVSTSCKYVLAYVIFLIVMEGDSSSTSDMYIGLYRGL